MKKKTYILGIGTVLLLVILFAVFESKSVSSFENIDNFDGNIQIYKSGSCGCCDVYSNYFKTKGNSNVEVVDLEDLDLIKQQYNVPQQLESCHTTIVGDYFVEGHMPLEAVEKLLQEKPNIKGIALPGMPSGSPGMPGAKKGDFVVYAVNYDGSYEEFMRV